MARYVAIIDLGKTNSKLAIVDTATATEIEVLTQSSATRQDTPYPSLDEATIWQFIESSLADLATKHNIDAISVTAHGATAALVDNSGVLSMPVMDYEFAGVDELADEYDSIRPTFAESGSPRLPGGLNIGAQLFWQQRYHRQAFNNTNTVLTWPQYWVHRLCNVQNNDVTSLGCHTDLYAPHKKQLSSLVEHQRWSSLFPDTIPSGRDVGCLNADSADRLGLPSSARVHSGIHDSNASLVPHLLNNTGAFSVVSTGTWTICMSIGDSPIDLIESRDCLLNVNAYGEPVASSRFMGGREREILLNSMPGTENIDAEHALNALQQLQQSPAETAPTLLPTTVSNTGPFPDAAGGWINDHAPGSPETLVCCTSLYQALVTAECLSLIGSQGPIHVEGPSSRDPVYVRMLAAATGRPIKLSESATGTSVGAAMLVSPPLKLPVEKGITLDKEERRWLKAFAAHWRNSVSTRTN